MSTHDETKFVTLNISVPLLLHLREYYSTYFVNITVVKLQTDLLNLMEQNTNFTSELAALDNRVFNLTLFVCLTL